jgi:hypothetical protein
MFLLWISCYQSEIIKVEKMSDTFHSNIFLNQAKDVGLSLAYFSIWDIFKSREGQQIMKMKVLTISLHLQK